MRNHVSIQHDIDDSPWWMMNEEIDKLILGHLERRPKAKAQDIYKLLYQGVFGVGHIISDRTWPVLVEEANRINLDDHSEDPLLEPVSPDGSMVRVNLRQYLRAGESLETLFDVMRESAKHRGDPEVFLDYWSEFKRMVDIGLLSFPDDEIHALDEQIKIDGVKPRHHTEPYRVAYYPAYRVVLLEIYREKMANSG
jgi:hypothetical protein